MLNKAVSFQAILPLYAISKAQHLEENLEHILLICGCVELSFLFTSNSIYSMLFQQLSI